MEFRAKWYCFGYCVGGGVCDSVGVGGGGYVFVEAVMYRWRWLCVGRGGYVSVEVVMYRWRWL